MTVEGSLRIEPAVSAGGVVYRHGEQGIEVLLCGRAREHLWALPKGTPELGETIEQTAVREVREETGLGVAIEEDLGTIAYRFARPSQGVVFDKIVHHFLMRPTGSGSLDQHDSEYDLVEWFVIANAIDMVTHRNESQVVRRALDVIEARDGA